MNLYLFSSPRRRRDARGYSFVPEISYERVQEERRGHDVYYLLRSNLFKRTGTN